MAARRNRHLNAGQTASIAAQSGVDALYLNHISTRYSKQAILDEAQSEFAGAVLAYDLLRVTLPSEKWIED